MESGEPGFLRAINSLQLARKWFHTQGYLVSDMLLFPLPDLSGQQQNKGKVGLPDIMIAKAKFVLPSAEIHLRWGAITQKVGPFLEKSPIFLFFLPENHRLIASIFNVDSIWKTFHTRIPFDHCPWFRLLHRLASLWYSKKVIYKFSDV